MSSDDKQAYPVDLIPLPSPQRSPAKPLSQCLPADATDAVDTAEAFLGQIIDWEDFLRENSVNKSAAELLFKPPPRLFLRIVAAIQNATDFPPGLRCICPHASDERLEVVRGIIKAVANKLGHKIDIDPEHVLQSIDCSKSRWLLQLVAIAAAKHMEQNSGAPVVYGLTTCPVGSAVGAAKQLKLQSAARSGSIDKAECAFFAVDPHDIPSGCRLATEEEVQNHRTEVFALLGRWTVAKLADGFKVEGRCLGQTIGPYDEKGCFFHCAIVTRQFDKANIEEEEIANQEVKTKGEAVSSQEIRDLKGAKKKSSEEKDALQRTLHPNELQSAAGQLASKQANDTEDSQLRHVPQLPSKPRDHPPRPHPSALAHARTENAVPQKALHGGYHHAHTTPVLSSQEKQKPEENSNRLELGREVFIKNIHGRGTYLGHDGSNAVTHTQETGRPPVHQWIFDHYGSSGPLKYNMEMFIKTSDDLFLVCTSQDGEVQVQAAFTCRPTLWVLDKHGAGADDTDVVCHGDKIRVRPARGEDKRVGMAVSSTSRHVLVADEGSLDRFSADWVIDTTEVDRFVSPRHNSTPHAALSAMTGAAPTIEEQLEKVRGFLNTRKAMERSAEIHLPKNLMDAFDDFENKDILFQECVPFQDAASSKNPKKPGSFEELSQAAKGVHLAFSAMMKSLVEKVGLNPEEYVSLGGHLMLTDDGQPLQRLALPPLKHRQRCEEKVRDDYKGDWSKLLDVVRCSIVLDTEDELQAVATALKTAGPQCKIARLKNRFKKPQFTGYRDALYSVRFDMPNQGYSHVCEIQLHLTVIIYSKKESHQHYAFFRSYFSGNVDAVKERMDMLLALRDTNGSLQTIVDSAVNNKDEEKLVALAQLLGPKVLFLPKLQVEIQRARLKLVESGDDALVASRRFDLGRARSDAAQYDDALRELQQTLDLRTKLFGADSVEVASALHQIATVHGLKGELQKALQIHTQALAIREKQLGEDSVDTADSVNQMGEVKRQLEHHEDAMNFYDRALKMRTKVLGREHADTAQVLNNIAIIKMKQGNKEEAKETFDQVLDINRKIFGAAHPKVADTLNNIAVNRLNAGILVDETLRYFMDAYEIYEKTVGRGHIKPVEVLENIGVLHFKRGEFVAAAREFQKVLEPMKKLHGASSKQLGMAWWKLGKAHKENGVRSAARAAFEHAVQILPGFVGDDNACLREARDFLEEIQRSCPNNGSSD